MAADAASLIPERHNYPGFADVLGARHAAGLRTPAETYGVSIGHRRVYQINLTSHSFGATAGGVEMQARRAPRDLRSRLRNRYLLMCTVDPMAARKDIGRGEREVKQLSLGNIVRLSAVGISFSEFSAEQKN